MGSKRPPYTDPNNSLIRMSGSNDISLPIDMEEIFILTAKLIYTNVLRVLNDASTPAHMLLRAAKPFFAAQCPRRVVREVDNYLLKVLMARLKRSKLPAHWYQLLLKHMSVSLVGDSVGTPFAFEE